MYIYIYIYIYIHIYKRNKKVKQELFHAHFAEAVQQGEKSVWEVIGKLES